MQNLPRTRLGRRYIRVTRFSDLRGQTSKHGLGYDPKKDTEAKKFISFIPEGSTEFYQGKIEKWKKEEVKKPRFEIFKDVIDSSKGKRPPLPDMITKANIDELIKNLGSESKIETLNYAKVTVVLKLSIDNILFEDTTIRDDLCTFPLFETDDVMNSKVNAIKLNFCLLVQYFFLMVVCIALIKTLAYLTFIPYALNHLILAQKMNRAFCVFQKILPLEREERLKKY